MKKDSKTLGVIIGRFQIDKLHEGHVKLIQTVSSLHKNFIILIGTTDQQTADDPLDFANRFYLFNNIKYKSIGICELPNYEDDKDWSKKIDSIISNFFCIRKSLNGKAKIYGARRNSLKAYTGKHQTVSLPLNFPVSGKKIRKEIRDTVRNSPDFRAGVIYAHRQRITECSEIKEKYGPWENKKI